MSNRPHSRVKNVVNKTVKVEKKKVEKNNTKTKLAKGILSSLFKK